ncbi:MAG: DUF4331 domain-containing protein [Polyangiaceae bacterium]|nr:DUF4331 domain-containing protein [Polyangiaceae bacterium]
MHRPIILGALGTLLITLACSSNNDSDNSLSPLPDGGEIDGAGLDSAPPGPPAPPALGAVQITRMGRPITNMMLNHTFDSDAAAKQAAVDEYNANSKIGTWNKYVSEFETNLAFWDMLDGDCGNQALVDWSDPQVPGYKPLATTLADDRLWVDTSKSTCTTYFGVEANATGLLANTDCGGRKLNDEVIKITYTMLATGKMDTTITDGTTPVAAKTNGTTFPYLAPAP